MLCFVFKDFIFILINQNYLLMNFTTIFSCFRRRSNLSKNNIFYAFWLFIFLFSQNVIGQTLLIDPTAEGGFENGSTFEANGWTLVGDVPNTWVVGSAPGWFTGSAGAYVSNDTGTSWAYTNNAISRASFYRDVTFPAGTETVTLNFDWRANGNDTNWDNLLVYVMDTEIVPSNVGPTTTNTTTTGWSGYTNGTTGYFLLQRNGTSVPTQTTNVNYSFTSAQIAYVSGSTKRLVFVWKNDGSGGTNPPASLDNISLKIFSCERPTTLTASGITNDSAVLGWTSEGTLFDIEYGVTGFTPSGSPTSVNTTGVTNSFLLENLDANTAYQYYVRQDCGAENGVSEWAGPFSFKTSCGVLTVPTAVQNFTGYTGAAPATLDCWSETVGDFTNGFSGSTSAWQNQNFNNSGTHANGTAAYINLYGSAFGVKNDWLISPAVDLGDGSTPYQLEFEVSVRPWTESNPPVPVNDMGEKFVKLVISTDGGATWLESNVIKTYDNSDIPSGLPADEGRRDIFSLDGYTGVVKFAYYAFATETTPDLRFYIDNWRVNIVPTCDAPTALTATDVTLNGATLGWTSDGNNFDIEWGPVDFVQGGEDSTLVTGIATNSYAVTVSEGGTYQFYVRQDCGDTEGVSEWAGPFNFYVQKAGEDCSAPVVVTVLPYTTTDDTANYGDNPSIEGSPGASGCGSTNNYLNGNDVVYAYTSDFDGLISVSLDPTATYAGIFAYADCAEIGENCIGGAVAGNSTNEINFELQVTNGSTYYFVISTWATPQTTGYTLEISKLLCPVPTALTASNVTAESAVLAWTSEGTLFDVEFGETGFEPTGNPSDENTTGVANPFTLEGLTANTTYQYYVRQDCGEENGTSDWAGPFTFTTDCEVLTVPTAVQDFTGYTGAAPATLACWKEATGNFADGVSGATSSWMNQNYNNNDTHPNGTAAYINLYGADSEWLISPAIDLGDGTADYQLKYDVSIKPWSGTAPVTTMAEKFVKVVVSTDGGATWLEGNVLKTYDSLNIPADGGITETVSLVGYTGVIKIAYYAHSTTLAPDLRFFIDNWSVIVNPCADIQAPAGETEQTLTEGQTLADLTVTGENLVWYSDEALQNQISATTVAENNTTYYVTQTIGECTSGALPVTVEVTLSAGNFDLVSLKVYPNPTNDYLTVSYSNDITSIAVINMVGQTLMTKNVNANTTQIDMTSLPTGNYFVKVTVEGAAKTIKIVKN